MIKLSNKQIDEVSRKIINDAVKFLCDNPTYINTESIINTLCSISEIKLVIKVCISKAKYLSIELKNIDNVDSLPSEMNTIKSFSIEERHLKNINKINPKTINALSGKSNILNQHEGIKEMKKEYETCLQVLFNLLNEFTNYLKNEENDIKNQTTKNAFLDSSNYHEYVKITLKNNLTFEEINEYIDIIADEIFQEKEYFLHNILFSYYIKHNLQEKLYRSKSIFVGQFIEKIYTIPDAILYKIFLS